MKRLSYARKTGILMSLQELIGDLDQLATRQFQLVLREIQPEVFRLIRIAFSLAGLAVLALVLAVVLLVCPRCRVA